MASREDEPTSKQDADVEKPDQETESWAADRGGDEAAESSGAAPVGAPHGEVALRGLILAGGGLKVAFQAGVLQVWLDEAEISFDHADGASGGVFNLAMYCQGMTGRQIADNWRATQPLDGLSVNWAGLIRGWQAPSVLLYDRFADRIFGAWDLDWDRIRTSDRSASFNAYNFTKQKLAVRNAKRMTRDFLIACVSLPLWFPPVTIGDDRYIDAVYVTDANLERSISRLIKSARQGGTDLRGRVIELWVIWTVNRRGIWRDGFVAQYFQTIEATANGRLRQILKRINTSNAALVAGEPSKGFPATAAPEFPCEIRVRILEAEVPVHYLFNLSQDRLAEAVNLGVQAAREWCRREGVTLGPPLGGTVPRERRLRFTEEMRGRIALGADTCRAGWVQGDADETELTLHLTIDIDDVKKFVLEPEHLALLRGWIDCDALGGRRPVEGGTFNLFVQKAGPADLRMYYRVEFTDAAGHPLILEGVKYVRDEPRMGIWPATTTLFVKITRPGEPEAPGVRDPDAPDADAVARGVVRLSPLAFLQQLASMRASAPTLSKRIDVMREFGQLFLGKLWDVYAQNILSSSPI